MEKDAVENSTPKTKVKDFETFSNNPFIPKTSDVVKNWKIHARKRKSKYGKGEMASHNGGEMFEVEVLIIGDWIINERAEFSKLYPVGRDTMKDLKQAGMKMLCFLLKSLKTDNDIVYLGVEAFLEYSGYENKKSYYEGVFELLKMRFIGRCIREHDYYVNPSMVFNGKRYKIPVVAEEMKEIIRLKNSRYEDGGHK
jgi:hypothetical protein